MGWADARLPVQTPDCELVNSISVFFPAYNDAGSLSALLARTFEVLRRWISDHEVIVINDGSTDHTAELLNNLAEQYRPYLRIVTHSTNLGYGAALRSGFDAATKDWIFYTDGDGQYDPQELELLLDAVGPGTGLVNGYKTRRNDPWHRIVIGTIYNHLARAFFRIRIRDIDCDFRLIRRDLVNRFDLKSTSGTICIELIRKLELSNAEIAEVPVSHYPRLHGRSQFFRMQSLATTFLQLCRLAFTLVLLPAFAQIRWIWMSTAILGAAFLAYWRALGLPFIADDYIQIELGRDYGPFSKWSTLALIRCTAAARHPS